MDTNRPQARNTDVGHHEGSSTTAASTSTTTTESKCSCCAVPATKPSWPGTDISQFRAFSTPEDALTYERNNNRYAGRLESLKKPTIAMIRGACTGGGAAFAPFVLRHALDGCLEVAFRRPSLAHAGQHPVHAEFPCAPVSLIGPARTKDLIFTARLIGAEEGRSIGVFNEIVEPERLEQRTLELAEQIAGNAPLTIQAAKMAVQRIVNKLRLEEAEDLVLMCYMSEDFREGVAAFAENGKPEVEGP